MSVALETNATEKEVKDTATLLSYAIAG